MMILLERFVTKPLRLKKPVFSHLFLKKKNSIMLNWFSLRNGFVQSSLLLLIILAILPAHNVYAQDNGKIITLMLTEEQRSLINKRRNSFLYKKVKRKSIKKNTKPTKYKKIVKSRFKKVTVSSVIVSPYGNKTIRINGKFIKQSAKDSSSKSANIRIGGKTIDLPVGKTYLINSKKIVNTHSQK